MAQRRARSLRPFQTQQTGTVQFLICENQNMAYPLLVKSALPLRLLGRLSASSFPGCPLRMLLDHFANQGRTDMGRAAEELPRSSTQPQTHQTASEHRSQQFCITSIDQYGVAGKCWSSRGAFHVRARTRFPPHPQATQPQIRNLFVVVLSSRLLRRQHFTINPNHFHMKVHNTHVSLSKFA